MKNYQKGFIVSLLIIVIALLIVGGGYYIYTLKSKSVTTTSSNNVDTQSQMYTDATHGFSFQYPSNWHIKVQNKDVIIVQVSDESSNAAGQSNSFMVRTIGDLDLNNLPQNNDTGWQSDHKAGDPSPVVPMRAIYYPSKNINLVLIGFDISSQSILNQIAASFKFN